MASWYGGFPPYVPVAERRAMALRHARKLEKKGAKLNPVTVNGRIIASSWWGKSWCQNLERYADFAYRLDRGRAYVRNGMVLDMRVAKGVVKALVAGSRPQPYEVSVRVKPLRPAVWSRLQKLAAGRIGSLQALLAGSFPEELKETFFEERAGLFPTPKEIDLDCTCPDWAEMCKHVAAALYGVGARVDSDPSMFFLLRGVSMEELVGRAAAHERKRLLRKRPVASERVLTAHKAGGRDLSALFGVPIDTAAQPPVAPVGKTRASSTPAPKRSVPRGHKGKPRRVRGT